MCERCAVFRLFGAMALGLLALAAVAQPAAAAPTRTTIYNFCSTDTTTIPCTDGRLPYGTLLKHRGSLYGTANEAGAHENGVVFKLTPVKSGWKERVLYSFCSRSTGTANCTDGAGPVAGLVRDSAGEFFGTTAGGGANGKGVVFALVPHGAGTYREKVLYSFCALANCTDGAEPQNANQEFLPPAPGVIIDGNGNLYGTTERGGANNEGVVFKVTQRGTETVLYDFCGAGGNACTDGALPEAGVIMDTKGNLYGTVSAGGAQNSGAAFVLDRKNRSYSEHLLYSFCTLANCVDGQTPVAGLLMDRKGDLFGTTFDGGTGKIVLFGQTFTGGTIFELTPGAGGAYSETVLYNFCSLPDTGLYTCLDGSNPASALVADAYGDLYGTTYSGGADSEDSGTVFALLHDPFEQEYANTVSELASFCSTFTRCPSGSGIGDGVILGRHGEIFGTTPLGGSNTGGTAFELMP